MTIPLSTPQSNIALMRTAFAAFGRKDADVVVDLMPPDFLINIAGVPYQKKGTATWRKHAALIFSAFPDLQVRIEEIFAAEDKVAVRLRITGTHAGEFLGIQPTGRKVDYESTEIYRIADGKIAEEWICSDMLTLMAQIGGQGLSMGKLASMWLAGYRAWFALGLGVVLGALGTALASF
ncbi:MAG: ester cyclase [Shinella sp.]|uniref:ester cyclase n=1 Tax=Shinella sp. TaxID=1870904 RepID=UPI0040353238